MLNWKNFYNFSIFFPVNKMFIENANVDFHVNSIMNVIVLHTTAEKTEALSDILLENLGLKFEFYTQQENYEFFENAYLKSIIKQFIIALIVFAITIWIANRNILKGNRLLLNELSSSISENINRVQIRKFGYTYLEVTFLLGLIVIFVFTAYERFSYWAKKDTLVAAYGFLGLINIDWGAWLTVLFIVVRQTISKWEQGLSVPDSDLLIKMSEVLETPVSVLLGEKIVEQKADDLKAISEKLEVINLQLAQRKELRNKVIHWLFILLCAGIMIIAAGLIASSSPYLGWNYSDPETAVVGVTYHAFEWLFFRIAPIILIGGIVGIIVTRKKR